MNAKILLVGSTGQVGKELSFTLSSLGEVVEGARHPNSKNMIKLDLTNNDQIREVIQTIKPDLIVNSGAYTAVDQAELEPELAQQINTIAPSIIAEEMSKLRGKFIHISTDYVFDGSKNTPYLETDNTNPLGVYGKTKLAGEKAIQNTNVDYLILRTAWVYGIYGQKNFVKTMVKLSQEKTQLKVVFDQVGSPTHALNIAETIAQIIPIFLAEKECKKVYHFVDNGVCSWYDFAVNIMEELKQLNYPIKVAEIKPIFSAEFPTPAQRPPYSVLSNRKITDDFNLKINHWQKSLKMMLQKLIIS